MVTVQHALVVADDPRKTEAKVRLVGCEPAATVWAIYFADELM
jgi:hypothetical protein